MSPTIPAERLAVTTLFTSSVETYARPPSRCWYGGVAHGTMRMTKHYTFEKTRQRYVFQIRVPSALRAAFDNRTTIRVALGRVPEATARSLAEGLRQAWEAKFDAARARMSRSRTNSAKTVALPLEGDITLRAAATWRLIQYGHYKDTLGRLRSADDCAWDHALADSEQSLTAARRRLLRGEGTLAIEAIADIDSRYRVRLHHSQQGFEGFTELINAAGVQMAESWAAVLRGEMTLDALRPSDAVLLPLLQFFGTPASALVPAWRQRLELVGKGVRPKTLAKYEAIVADLDAILGEVPVEMLDPAHIRALGDRWRGRKNDPATVLGKLTTLISLIRPIAPAAAELIRSQVPRTHLRRVRRLPFTKMQLATLRGAVTQSARCTTDDIMLLDLMMLTGARLSELLQSRAEHVRPTDDGWLLEIGGHPDDQVKTGTSRRTLPVTTAHIPPLAHWLAVRSKADGLIFEHAKPDKYGHYGNVESKRLNGIIRTLYSDRRLVLESTRNTVARTLRCEEVDPRVRRGLLGHADIDIHERHYDPVGLITPEDLVPAATVLAAFAGEVIGLATPPRAESRTAACS